METAPVALFAYNRPLHLRQTVEALRQNEQARQTDLFVFSDGPRGPAASPEVDRVREYLNGIGGFRNVHVCEREQNLGLARSITSGVGEVVARFGRVIVLEDDMVTSPFFLDYMNQALDLYEDEPRVISIHGYIYPVRAPLPETFFIKDTGCWGWATWKRGWDLFEPDGKKLLGELRARGLERAFNLDDSYDFVKLLSDQVAGRNDSWAIRWQASAFLQDKLTLFPGRSLLQNIGHDASGRHCGDSPVFDVELAKDPVRVEKIPAVEDEAALRALQAYFRSIRPGLRARLAAAAARLQTVLFAGRPSDA